MRSKTSFDICWSIPGVLVYLQVMKSRLFITVFGLVILTQGEVQSLVKQGQKKKQASFGLPLLSHFPPPPSSSVPDASLGWHSYRESEGATETMRRGEVQRGPNGSVALGAADRRRLSRKEAAALRRTGKEKVIKPSSSC